jgi:hypothetical protein
MDALIRHIWSKEPPKTTERERETEKEREYIQDLLKSPPLVKIKKKRSGWTRVDELGSETAIY